MYRVYLQPVSVSKLKPLIQTLKSSLLHFKPACYCIRGEQHWHLLSAEETKHPGHYLGIYGSLYLTKRICVCVCVAIHCPVPVITATASFFLITPTQKHNFNTVALLHGLGERAPGGRPARQVCPLFHNVSQFPAAPGDQEHRLLAQQLLFNPPLFCFLFVCFLFFFFFAGNDLSCCESDISLVSGNVWQFLMHFPPPSPLLSSVYFRCE